jgi:hypothetical protein
VRSVNTKSDNRLLPEGKLKTVTDTVCVHSKTYISIYEPLFLNVYGTQESIPRTEFCQPMYPGLAGRYDNPIPTRSLALTDCLKTPVPEIIDPVFAKTSQNARFLLSEYERFGLVFTKTRVYKFGHSSGYFLPEAVPY